MRDDARHGKTHATPRPGAAGPRIDAQFPMLREHGADPHAADCRGNTPLHKAAMINAGTHVPLLERGANPNAKSAREATFQRYYFKTPTAMLSADAKRQREAVVAWLRAHDMPPSGRRRLKGRPAVCADRTRRPAADGSATPGLLRPRDRDRRPARLMAGTPPVTATRVRSG